MRKTSHIADKSRTCPSTLRRLAAILIVGYAAAVILFYFLAGEQLHLRQSRGSLPLPAADCGTVELTAGSVVEQRFTTKIQRLEQIQEMCDHVVWLEHGSVRMSGATQDVCPAYQNAV